MLRKEAPETIGLALSGGGSRAIAFHLGCLRALHDLGVLEKVGVISTVSGGSVVGALYATHQGSFEQFEKKTRDFLRAGLVGPSVKKAFTSLEGLNAFICSLLLLGVNIFLMMFAVVVRGISWVLPGLRLQALGAVRAPLRRYASRTTILRRVLDDDVFGGRKFRDLPKDGPLFIANAADLRTGSSFYFSNRDSGSWRLGRVCDDSLKVSHGVAASAAYPLLLPALDETLAFEKRDGTRREERVTLTDGGVYDNLGLAPLWPDRDPSVSLNAQKIDTIICCRAGYGLRFDSPNQFMLARMASAFTTIHDRAQNFATKRLFDLRAAGQLKAFAMPYLGMKDQAGLCDEEGFVSREDVFGYPTDFSAMPDVWIEKLSKRGEQLTHRLVKEHLPHLLAKDELAC